MIYQTSTVEVIWKEDANAIFWKVKGFLMGEEFRESFTATLPIIKKNNIKNWYFNVQDMEVLTKDDINWWLKEWQPMWVESEIERVCIVDPRKAFGKISFKKLLNRELFKAFEMKFFLDEASALQALNS